MLFFDLVEEWVKEIPDDKKEIFRCVLTEKMQLDMIWDIYKHLFTSFRNKTKSYSNVISIGEYGVVKDIEDWVDYEKVRSAIQFNQTLFYVVENVFLHQIIISVCALTEKENSNFGTQNSIESLAETPEDKKEYDRIFTESCPFRNMLRNKGIAHFDRKYHGSISVSKENILKLKKLIEDIHIFIHKFEAKHNPPGGLSNLPTCFCDPSDLILMMENAIKYYDLQRYLPMELIKMFSEIEKKKYDKTNP